MTDEEFAAQKERIEAIVRPWLHRVGLGHWMVTCEYHRERGPKGVEDWHTGAEVRCKWEYQQAWIDFYCPLIADQKDDDVEDIVLHEIVHILVHEMRPVNQKVWERQHEERVVTLVTNALLWTYRRDQKLVTSQFNEEQG